MGEIWPYHPNSRNLLNLLHYYLLLTCLQLSMLVSRCRKAKLLMEP
jgi:hypothetical protein